MADSILNPKADGSYPNQNKQVELVSTTTGTAEKGWVIGSFLNSGAADVTVNGKTLEPGASITYPYIMNRSWDAISWDATGSSLKIVVVY